jgi:hypothetical protein
MPNANAKGMMVVELLKRTGATSITITYGKANVEQYYNVNREERFTDGEIDDIKLIHLILAAHHPRINAVRRLAMMVLEDIREDKYGICDELSEESITIFDSADSIRELDKAKENFTGKWKEEEVDETKLSRIDEIDELIDELKPEAEQLKDESLSGDNQKIIEDIERDIKHGKEGENGNKE